MSTQQGPENKGMDFLTRLGQTLRSGAETIVQETRELTRIGKIKVEILSLENERGRKFEEAGRLAHTLYKGGQGYPEELLKIFAEIDDIERRIDEKNREIERVRREGESKEKPPAPKETSEATAPESPASAVDQPKQYCPQCGARLDEGDVFCSKCGARVN
ncbi:MAG: zinc ribbon domain-containing protein [Candidatus Fermentithermobacillus carboniphilus]|uniref:Zinc ribbon domain-containing protein n=1 Tax=Candidatus Fermentithermobacillus carboniphilus TaxID=3085328 RepID=A0AAT9LCM0_9FIRM|nr:MAG: zinc ribbon domain-containing protein [Candidatus Fermentithermobacillus carboniphilus]